MEKKLTKTIGWIKTPLFKQKIIIEETYPLMTTHARFVRLLGSGNGKVAKPLTADEIEEFAYARLEVIRALNRKDFRHINVIYFIEHYFLPELRKLNYDGGVCLSALRNILKKFDMGEVTNQAYNNAVKNIFK